MKIRQFESYMGKITRPVADVKFLRLIFTDIPSHVRVRQLLMQSIKGCYHAVISFSYSSYSLISYNTRKCFSSYVLQYSSPLTCQAALGETKKDYNNVASFFLTHRGCVTPVYSSNKKSMVQIMVWCLFGANHNPKQYWFIANSTLTMECFF